jgi:4-amino-4-deoxy-L-arabinose transferase-like glycosyltransferase
VRKSVLHVCGLASLTLVGALLRLPPLWAHRFHEDEALYASWGLLISTHRDIMLARIPVDKPPLFLYILAHFFTRFGVSEPVARLPGLLAGILSIPLLYLLASRLYEAQTAGVATALFAASPMAILFSPTAFTDPVMLFFGIAASAGAALGSWALAGLGVGLAAVTKQQGILFLPLVIGIGWAAQRQNLQSRWRTAAAIAAGVFGVVLPILAALQWDRWRYLPPDRPGFLAQSAISYGGLHWVSLAEWPARVLAWLPWLGYLTASPWLNAIYVIGLPWLAWRAWTSDRQRRRRTKDEGRTPSFQRLGYPSQGITADLALLAYALGYWALHVAFDFQVWDRYLLPLAPIISLLGARILVAMGGWTLRSGVRCWGKGARPIGKALLVAILVLILAGPALAAASSSLPLGSDHGAYDGIDQVAAFLKTEMPPGAVLYHHWLGWHWRYYLYDVLFNFRYYDSTAALVADADGPPRIVRYIVFPGWRQTERDEAQTALAARGMAMIRRFQTRRADGSISFEVYRIEHKEPHDH